MDILHILTDVVRNSVLITGLVIVMMMMIESFNIESHGRFFSRLRHNRIGQVVLSAMLGSIPGCMGGFASVSLYTHRMISFGALIAMMIASSGDEAFVMLAMIPDKAWWIFLLLFGIAVVSGLLTDMVHNAVHRRKCHKEDHSGCGDEMGCSDGYEIHPEHTSDEGEKPRGKRHYGWKRLVMFFGTALFITALATGTLAHDHDGHAHEAHEPHTETIVQGHVHEVPHGTINLLSEDWMNVLFAVLSIAVLAVLIFASDHFVEEHLWKHIVKKHLPSIFAWTFGVLAVIAFGMQYIDISRWVSENTALMIILATLIGIIPESGPHMIFVTLYAGGIVPLPVLLASCISQDGHASIPLLAESKISFAKAKLINCAIALGVGFTAMLF